MKGKNSTLYSFSILLLCFFCFQAATAFAQEGQPLKIEDKDPHLQSFRPHSGIDSLILGAGPKENHLTRPAVPASSGTKLSVGEKYVSRTAPKHVSRGTVATPDTESGKAIGPETSEVLQFRDINPEGPVGTPDNYLAIKDTPLSIAAPGFLANDIDFNGEALTATAILDATDHGNLSALASGNFTYTPDAGYVGIDRFAYRMRDASQNFSDTVWVRIEVLQANRAPLGTVDFFSVEAGTTLTQAAPGFLLNDADPDGEVITATAILDAPDHGGLSAFSSGQLSYAPDKDFVGIDSFAYRMRDASLNFSDTVWAFIEVWEGNRPPVGIIDKYGVAYNQTRTVAAPGFLGNDYDPDGEALTATAILDATDNGGISALASGQMTYSPDNGFVGIDSFAYRMRDASQNFSDTVWVFLQVNPPSTIPIGIEDRYAVSMDETLSVPAPGFLVNDIDGNGEPLTATAILDATDHGGISALASGQMTYSPDEGYVGIDSFAYRMRDASMNFSDSVWVYIDVKPSFNRAPIGKDDYFVLPGGSNYSISAPGFLSNDIDLDGEALTATAILDATDHGGISALASGQFTYSPDDNFVGLDSFAYRMRDASLNFSDTVWVFLNVVEGNRAPIGTNDLYSVVINTPLAIAAPGFLANDLDLDGETLTATAILDSPDHGSISAFETGSFTYTPDLDFVGIDSFKYRMRDASFNSSDSITVVFNVLTPYPPPCEISGLSVGATQCSGEDFEFNFSFLPTSGSGDYEIVNLATTAVLASVSGAATDGMVTVAVSIDGPTNAGTMDVYVRDMNDMACASPSISVNILECNPLNPLPCSIENLMASSVACSTNSSEFTVSFDVSNGSGNYEVLDAASMSVLADVSGEAMTGAVIIPVSLGITAAGILDIVVVDAVDGACVSLPYSVTIPDCPPLDPANCSIGNLMATSPSCSGDDAEFTLSFDVNLGSGDYEVVDAASMAVLASVSGALENGNITLPVSLSGPTSAGTLNVYVVDAVDNTCMSPTYSVTIPECPSTDPDPGPALCFDANSLDPYLSSGGVTFNPDQFYDGGGMRTKVVAIDNTLDDEIYYTERYGKDFGYNIPLPIAGIYEVDLYFAETRFDRSNRRRFSVDAEGLIILSDYDIHLVAQQATMSSDGMNYAVKETFEVTVVDGELNLWFYVGNTGKNHAKINALCVRPAGSDPAMSFSSSEILNMGPQPGLDKDILANDDDILGIIQNLGEAMELRQNYPNPFRSETTIEFYLPEAGEALLNFFSLDGRLLGRIEGEYVQGVNQVRVDRGSLQNASGTVMYQLEYNRERQVRRMVVVE